MPNSFSRFLSDEDLAKVREQYLEALAEVESEVDPHADSPHGQPRP